MDRRSFWDVLLRVTGLWKLLDWYSEWEQRPHDLPPGEKPPPARKQSLAATYNYRKGRTATKG